MIKKKAKSRTGKTNNSGARKVKQELNRAEVRKEIAQMPATEVASRAQAVIDEGIKRDNWPR